MSDLPKDHRLPQQEGADYFVVLDPEHGEHFIYDAALGRSFGHEHIKDAQLQPELRSRANKWVVRRAWNENSALSLAMLIRMMAHALKTRDPQHTLPGRAMDLLSRYGLQGSVLRGDESEGATNARI